MNNEEKKALDAFREKVNGEMDLLYEFFDEVLDSPQAGPFRSMVRGGVPGVNASLRMDFSVEFPDPENFRGRFGSILDSYSDRNLGYLKLYMMQIENRVYQLMEYRDWELEDLDAIKKHVQEVVNMDCA